MKTLLRLIGVSKPRKLTYCEKLRIAEIRLRTHIELRTDFYQERRKIAEPNES